MEIWKDVIGFEGLYQVSYTGKIKSLKRYRSGRNGAKTMVNERVLACKIDKYGYRCVTLCSGIKKHSLTVHRLVAKAFLDNPENKPEVNHLDHDKQNNSVDNLEWATRKEQIQYDRSTILKDYRGETHVLSKLKTPDVVAIRKLYKEGKTQVHISKLFSITQAQVSEIVLKKQWKHV